MISECTLYFLFKFAESILRPEVFSSAKSSVGSISKNVDQRGFNQANGGSRFNYPTGNNVVLQSQSKITGGSGINLKNGNSPRDASTPVNYYNRYIFFFFVLVVF